MGVLENVVVLGRSGADLESEWLHHQTSPPVADANYTSTALPTGQSGGGTSADQPSGEITFDEPQSTRGEAFPQSGGSTDLEHSPGAGFLPPDTSLSAEPEAPPTDPGANPEGETIDADPQPPPQS
jgi:hypothetical protein